MLYKDLLNEENKGLEECYSIEVMADDEVQSPPESLKMAGFVFKTGDDGLMDEKLLDVLISYRLVKVNLLLEVPSSMINDTVTVKYLMQLAGNVDFSLSFLPHGHNLVSKDYTKEQFNSVIKDVMKNLLEKPQFDKFVIPVTNFFEYMMLESLLDEENPIIKGFKPKEEYVVKNYVDVMSEEDSNEFKATIREKLYEAYGGKEGFKAISRQMMGSVVNLTEKMVVDNIKSQEQKPC